MLRRIALGHNALDLYGGVRRWDSEVVIDVDTGLFPIQILTGDTWTQVSRDSEGNPLTDLQEELIRRTRMRRK